MDFFQSNHELCTDSTKKHFKNKIFAFVTPWNPKGYELSLKFADKINYVSPSWYSVSFDKGDLTVDGL